MSTTGWLDPREQRAWRAFMAMQMHLRAQLNRRLQQDSGLSEADYAVLVHLSEAPGGRQRAFEIGRATRWEKSRLSHHLSRMADRGLVCRETCSTDPRGAVIVLTEGGRAAISEAAPLHVEQIRRWFVSVLTPAQLDVMTEIGESVLARLAEAPCGGDGAASAGDCAADAGRESLPDVHR